MRIAVNARHLLPDRLEGIGMVTHEVMRRIAVIHPEDQLDYYFDRGFDRRFLHAPNVKGHVRYPVTRLPLLIRYWLNKPVRTDVRRQKANVFFSPDGFIPLGMSVPKVSMVHDIAFVRYPEHLPPRIRRFYATWMPRYLAYTNHIITVSEFSRNELIDAYRLPAEKVSVVYNGVTDAYVPIDAAQKQKAREKYAKGIPYFLNFGAIHPRKNIITLVQAFEKFKRNYRTEHQLVLAGRPSWHTEDIFTAIQQSEFRNEILLPGYVPTEEASGLVGAAEAMVYPSWYEGFGLPMVEAMAAGVPVICSNASSLPEVAGEAALLFEPHQPDALAAHMHAIISDADLRYNLIEKGFNRQKAFSWDKAAEEVYSILKFHAKA